MIKSLKNRLRGLSSAVAATMADTPVQAQGRVAAKLKQLADPSEAEINAFIKQISLVEGRRRRS